jgi:hypothetical protein
MSLILSDQGWYNKELLETLYEIYKTMNISRRIKVRKNIMKNKLADEMVLFQYKSKINNQIVTVM